MQSAFNALSCRVLFLITAALITSGCASYGQKASNMRDSLLAGQVGVALAMAEKEDAAESDVLSSMNKGILRRMAGDYQGSNRILEVAKQQIEELHGVSVSEQLGAVTVNDTMRAYAGDRYEQVLLHAFMAMNYIQMNDLDAARVEILQADVKMREWGEQPEEDPFVRYLSGMIFEALGETDQALVAYRQAKDVYQSTTDKQAIGIPGTLKRDLLRLLAKERLWNEYASAKKAFKLPDFKPEKTGKKHGELIVILNNGLSPVRSESSIVTAVGGEIADTVKISVPTYRQQPAYLFRPRLITGDGTVRTFETVENIDALARKALESDMPVITARAITRAVVKHQTQEKAEDKGGALASFLMTVTNIVTERADTRSWTTLPQEIQLARVVLPAGQQNIRIEMLNPAGAPVEVMDSVVDIRAGKQTFFTTHWTAPNMITTVATGKVATGK